MADKASKKTKQAHQKDFVRKYDVIYYERPVITAKEARKFFTKEERENLSDEDLMRIVGLMKQIAEALFDNNLVPQNNESMI